MGDDDAGAGHSDGMKPCPTIQDEKVQESFEMIKARTMYEMVEELGPNKQRLLFLTNSQADLLAKSEDSLEKMFSVLEIRKHKLLIYLAHTGGFTSSCEMLGNPDRKMGLPIGAINWGLKQGAFATLAESTKAEELFDKFILDVVLPLAVQTQAVILCSGTKCCQLSCALDRCMMLHRAKFAVDQPFSIITMNAATANLYNYDSPDANWRALKEQSTVWSRREKKILEVQHTYLYPDAQDDLIANAPCMVLCDTIDMKKNEIGDKGPFMGFVSAVIRYLSRELPAITFKGGASFHVDLDKAALSEATSLRMIDSLQSGSPVIFLDVTDRELAQKSANATSRDDLIKKATELHDKACNRLLELNKFDFHNVSALSHFHDVLTGDGGTSTVGNPFSADDMACNTIYDELKKCTQPMTTGAVTSNSTNSGIDDELGPPTTAQIEYVADYLAHRQFHDMWQFHPRRDELEAEGITYQHFFKAELNAEVALGKMLLAHKSFHGVHAQDSKAVLDLASALVKLDRLPTENTTEALKLLKQMWIEFDIAMYLAFRYKRLARVLYFLVLLVGVAIVAPISAADDMAKAIHVIFGLSLLTLLLLSATSFYNPSQRGRQLRACASSLESTIWRFRTRSAEFAIPLNNPKNPDYVLAQSFIEWRHSLTRGTDLLSTALEKKYPDHVFKHYQLRSSDKLSKAKEAYYNWWRAQDVASQISSTQASIDAGAKRDSRHSDMAPNNRDWSKHFRLSRLLSEDREGSSADVDEARVPREAAAPGLRSHLQAGAKMEEPGEMLEKRLNNKSLEDSVGSAADVEEARVPREAARPGTAAAVEPQRQRTQRTQVQLFSGRGSLLQEGRPEATFERTKLDKLTNQYQELLEKLQRGRREVAAPTKIDDFQSPIKPHHYVELRLNTMLHFYQSRIPKLGFRIRVVKVLLTLCTIATAVLSSNASWLRYVPIATTVSAALTSWSSFSDQERRLEQYTETVRSLHDVVSWWDSMDDVEQASTSNISKLILSCEAIIGTERRSDLASALADNVEVAKPGDDHGINKLQEGTTASI